MLCYGQAVCMRPGWQLTNYAGMIRARARECMDTVAQARLLLVVRDRQHNLAAVLV